MATSGIIFTNGCFDLFHAGHLALLEFARSLGGPLTVGLNTDDSIRRLKGDARPIIPYAQREAILKSLKCVNRVVPLDDDTPCELIRSLRPKVIVKGPGYSAENMPEAAVANEYGGRVSIFVPPESVVGVSTSGIIERIKS